MDRRYYNFDIAEEEFKRVLNEDRFKQVPCGDFESNVAVNCWKRLATLGNISSNNVGRCWMKFCEHLATLGHNINQKYRTLLDKVLGAFTHHWPYYQPTMLDVVE